MKCVVAPLRSLLFSALMLAAGCGPKPQPGDESSKPAETPGGLAVEHVISGRILGQTLKAPVGLAADRNGVLYVLDGGHDRLIRFMQDLTPLRDIGGRGSQPGQMYMPTYVTVDNDLNLLVSDAGNMRICRFNSRLEYVDEITLKDEDDPLKYGRPAGVAVTDYGEVWLSDVDNNHLVVFDNVGHFAKFVGGYGYGGADLLHPEEIVSVDDDEFWVCDRGNRAVVVFDDYGSFLHRILIEDWIEPVGLAFDTQHRLWVIDRGTGRLFVFGPGRSLLATFGPILAGTDSKLVNPSDIAFLPDGRLAISDTGNDRVLICRVLAENK